MHADQLCDCGDHQPWIADRRQVDEPDAVRELFEQFGCGLKRQAGFAAAARASQGCHPDIAAAQQGTELLHLLLTPISGVGCTGRFGGVAGESREWREVRWQVGGGPTEKMCSGGSGP